MNNTAEVLNNSYIMTGEKDPSKLVSCLNKAVDAGAFPGAVISIIKNDGQENEFNFIKKFILEKEINSSGVNNGVKVEIRGEIDNKSGYSLNNVYYTRNTIF